MHFQTTIYEGCSKNNVSCTVFRGQRVQRVQNFVRSVESLLNCNNPKSCAYKYTDLGTVNITLLGVRYSTCKMTEKRAENSMEIRAYIKARSLTIWS